LRIEFLNKTDNSITEFFEYVYKRGLLSFFTNKAVMIECGHSGGNQVEN